MNTSKNRLDLTFLKKELTTLAARIAYYKKGPILEWEKKLNATKDRETRQVVIAKLNKVRREQKGFSTDYRNLHIAYGELRGVPRKKMENVVTATKLDEGILQKIKDRFVHTPSV